VLARINFLLGLGLLILIAFYYAGVYLLIPPVSAIAPGWVKPVAGIALLAAVGITVQLLSMAMSRNAWGCALQTRRAMRPDDLREPGGLCLWPRRHYYAAKGLVIDGMAVSNEQS
jgi:hypothetical protein